MYRVHNKCLAMKFVASIWAIVLFSSALLAHGSHLGQRRMHETHSPPFTTPEVAQEEKSHGLRQLKYSLFYVKPKPKFKMEETKVARNRQYYGDMNENVFIPEEHSGSAQHFLSDSDFVNPKTADIYAKSSEFLPSYLTKDHPRSSGMRRYKDYSQTNNDKYEGIRFHLKDSKILKNMMVSNQLAHVPIENSDEKHLLKLQKQRVAGKENYIRKRTGHNIGNIFPSPSIAPNVKNGGKTKAKRKDVANRFIFRRNTNLKQEKTTNIRNDLSLCEKQIFSTHNVSRNLTLLQLLESRSHRETPDNLKTSTKLNSRFLNKWQKSGRLGHNALNWEPNSRKLTGSSRKLRAAGNQGKVPRNSSQRSITFHRKPTDAVSKKDLESRLASLDGLDFRLISGLLHQSTVLQWWLIKELERVATEEKFQTILLYLLAESPSNFLRRKTMDNEEAYSNLNSQVKRHYLFDESNFQGQERPTHADTDELHLIRMNSVGDGSINGKTNIKKDNQQSENNRAKSNEWSNDVDKVNTTSEEGITKDVNIKTTTTTNNTTHNISTNSVGDTRTTNRVNKSMKPNTTTTTTDIRMPSPMSSAARKISQIPRFNVISNTSCNHGDVSDACSRKENFIKTQANSDLRSSNEIDIASTFNILPEFDPLHMAIEGTRTAATAREAIISKLFSKDKISYKMSPSAINLLTISKIDELKTAKIYSINQIPLSRRERSVYENNTDIGDIISANESDVTDNEAYYNEELTMFKSPQIPVHYVFLMPFEEYRMFSLPKVVGAIDLAFDQVKDRDLLPGCDLYVDLRDSRCSISEAMNEAINVYDDKLVDVFIGPVCDYAVAPIARQIRYWQKPLITPGALAGAFGEETTFSFLIRVGANFHSTAEMMISIMDQFKWRRIKIIYDPNGLNSIMDRYCLVASDTIVKTIRTDPNKTQDYQGFYSVNDFFEEMKTEIGNEWAGK